jgi:hypothetical protein
LRFLQANPGPNFVELPQRDLDAVEGLRRRGLVSMEKTTITSKRGVSVWEVKALQ